ncbi:MAG: 4Fe-4S dicluster domain-containing protein [Dehalococcoidia bacterium]|nr:4Fe-4S dicluster domain-containing protein [Dehalococcoidia bacterium]
MKRVYVKEEACIGCHLCEVYCQLQHARSKDIIKALRKETPHPLPRLRVEEKGVVSFSVRCQQCDEAPCVQACITGALARNPVSSLIEIDPERCIGCWTCLLACPLGAIKQDIEQKKVLKCDLCQGEEIPVCVANCPNEALVYVESQDDSPSLESEVSVPVK